MLDKRSTPETQQYSFYGTTFSKRGFDYYAREGKQKEKEKIVFETEV